MDGLCLKTGIHGMAPKISVGGALGVRASTSQVCAVGRSVDKSAVAPPPQKVSSSRFSFRYPLKSLWPGGRSGGGGDEERYNGIAIEDAVVVENKVERKAVEEMENIGEIASQEGQNENWVLKILRVKSLWRERQGRSAGGESENDDGNDNIPVTGKDDEDDQDSCDGCRVDSSDDDEVRIEFDRDSFSRMLRRVSLAEAKLYAQMSYLGNLAYSIPKIKPGNLLKYRGLRFVTSSIKKRELAMEAEKSQASVENQEAERNGKDEAEYKEEKSIGPRISASAAYGMVASAASYLHSHTKNILPFKSLAAKGSKNSSEGSCGNDGGADLMNVDVASLIATTDSVTAVVAAKEEVKQAVADNLNSTHSSPCEWFICDDDQSATRYFVIQGSESLASWQANLLFEPVQFEGLDVLVHRGIYEAAKGIYEQMLPEVREHLKSHGNHATFRFTGHSLGGSLSLLINLMLLIRGEVPAHALLPVITFGSPSIMCGGDHLLQKIGLPRSHVQAITMHGDIVPRAFSCNYPNHAAKLLKAVNRNFRNHPCLNNQKLLYAPMGELLILQPDEKISPQHDLLPSGNGLYFLSCALSDAGDAEKLLRAAQTVFLNSPHPLEILSDRSAYGSEGRIQRDHDMKSYLKGVRSVFHQELSRMRKAERERHKVWWSVILPHNTNAGIIVGRSAALINWGLEQINFSGILHNGRETIQRFSRFVASHHMHLLVFLLFSVKLLLVGAYTVMSFPLSR
ncbi:hypothetical protein SLEP1_g48116 [Rubroshorea leprosula]|uniref:Fungal lipase-type domain-containing protein n=1 Tax=Rubroshorea leprosula TaxID=152421 RepID=A0AAV5LST4_9ROSI|nr:hypothetical protein SLEP1_g48116 [Rubroshorea leprosula]